MSPKRIVLDTGVLVSRVLKPNSLAGLAVTTAEQDGLVLVSNELIEELLEVLSRPKFRQYVDAADARALVRALVGAAEIVAVTVRVQACRDPKDDKILELAQSGEADLIVTGDLDLLVLDPFAGIPILTPRRFIDESG